MEDFIFTVLRDDKIRSDAEIEALEAKIEKEGLEDDCA